MTRYSLLISPSANRVYAASAPRLGAAELDVANRSRLAGALSSARISTLAGVDCLEFELSDHESPLDDESLRVLGTLSTGLALFAHRDGLLEPMPLPRPDQFDDDLLTIGKYPGKTNEQFTRLLVNVTAWTADLPRLTRSGRRPRLLDPVSGRGTTLNQALMYGWHATGIDVDARDADAYRAFLTTWLRSKRLKHRIEVSRLRRQGEAMGQRLTATVARDRDAHRDGDLVELEMLQADTRRAADLLAADSVDLVVGDLPYGVRHGSRSRGPRELDRSPLELLEDSLAGWVRALRPGGAMGLSFNTITASRDRVIALVASAGLEPCDEEPYRGFEHRVDQAITRDLVVARLAT